MGLRTRRRSGFNSLGPLVVHQFRVPPPDGDGGGGSGGGSGDGNAPDLKAELEAAKAKIRELEAKTSGKGGSGKDGDDDPDLNEKVRKEREAREAAGAREKKLEKSLRFTMGAQDFLKQNEALLPQEAADIFAQAEKEKFEDAVEKDEAIKSGLIQAFFRVQANVDLLTATQKEKLDGYLKLTKTGKQEQAQSIYDMVFEPAFENLKRQKKAEALSRGHGESSDVEDGYRKRLMAGSRKHYLGEKNA